MKSNFFKDFIDGFISKGDFEPKRKISSEEYLNRSFALIEKNFKKMSSKNETEEKLFHKK